MPNELLQRSAAQVQRLTAVDRALAEDQRNAEQVRSVAQPNTPLHQVAAAWLASTNAHRKEVHAVIQDVQMQGTALAKAGQGMGGPQGVGVTSAVCTNCTPPWMTYLGWAAVAGGLGYGGWILYKKFKKKPSRKENPLPPSPLEIPQSVPGRPSPRFGHGETIHDRHHGVKGAIYEVRWAETYSVWAYHVNSDRGSMWIYDHKDVVRARAAAPSLPPIPEGDEEEFEEVDEEEEEEIDE
jgi:hypothetical protein